MNKLLIRAHARADFRDSVSRDAPTEGDDGVAHGDQRYDDGRRSATGWEVEGLCASGRRPRIGRRAFARYEMGRRSDGIRAWYPPKSWGPRREEIPGIQKWGIGCVCFVDRSSGVGHRACRSCDRRAACVRSTTAVLTVPCRFDDWVPSVIETTAALADHQPMTASARPLYVRASVGPRAAHGVWMVTGGNCISWRPIRPKRVVWVGGVRLLPVDTHRYSRSCV